MKKIRVAIIVSHPIQHFVHFYRALAKEPSLDLLVIFCSDMGVRGYFDKDMGLEISWASDLLSGYKYVILPESSRINDASFLAVNNPSILDVLRKFKPQLVKLNGYSQLTMIRALVWCKLNKVPVMMWSDSELIHKRSFPKRVIKQCILRPLLALFSGFLTVGDNNENYFKNYGISEKKMFRVPFTIDEETFSNVKKIKNEISLKLRKELNIPQNAFVVLMVGKLIERKRPADLIKALDYINNMERSGRDVYAVFAGDGCLKIELENLSKTFKDKCRFLGFVNVDKLPGYYMMSDVLAHLSEKDPHPLTNSEAIISGLPLIVSDKIGTIGQTDVVRHEKNGIVCPCGDIRAIANAIVRLSDDSISYQKFSYESLNIFKEINISSSVNGFIKAVNALI